mgnify:CR=1 FL=1
MARCPACHRFYCRECVSEHEDRLLCAPCLAASTGQPHQTKNRLAVIGHAARIFLGLLAGWLFFQALGAILMRIPSDFHQGTVWTKSWLEE